MNLYRFSMVCFLLALLFLPSKVVAFSFFVLLMFAAAELLKVLAVNGAGLFTALSLNFLIIGFAGLYSNGPTLLLVMLTLVNGVILACSLEKTDLALYNSKIVVGVFALALIGWSGVVALKPTDKFPLCVLQECLLIVGLQDFFASITGKYWSVGRLAPAISPNKTLSGALGGFGGATLAWLVVSLLGYSNFTFFQLACVSICGVLGDLFFSSIKRVFHVKDFSRALGAKGGLLDRLDSAVFAVIIAECLKL